MTHGEFRIGEFFKCGDHTWKCTDIGTRTIVAVALEDIGPDWFTGPPYAVAEMVFDEYDIKGCTPRTRC